jgi:hypothetical protein
LTNFSKCRNISLRILRRTTNKVNPVNWCLFRHFPNSFTLKVKVKVQFTLEQTTKVERWSRDITLLFL